MLKQPACHELNGWIAGIAKCRSSSFRSLSPPAATAALARILSGLIQLPRKNKSPPVETRAHMLSAVSLYSFCLVLDAVDNHDNHDNLCSWCVPARSEGARASYTSERHPQPSLLH